MIIKLPIFSNSTPTLESDWNLILTWISGAARGACCDVPAQQKNFSRILSLKHHLREFDGFPMTFPTFPILSMIYSSKNPSVLNLFHIFPIYFTLFCHLFNAKLVYNSNNYGLWYL